MSSAPDAKSIWHAIMNGQITCYDVALTQCRYVIADT
jgi:hypothetical protein